MSRAVRVARRDTFERKRMFCAPSPEEIDSACDVDPVDAEDEAQPPTSRGIPAGPDRGADFLLKD